MKEKKRLEFVWLNWMRRKPPFSHHSNNLKYKVVIWKRVYRKVTQRNTTTWGYVNMCVVRLIVQIEKLDFMYFLFLFFSVMFFFTSFFF